MRYPFLFVAVLVMMVAPSAYAQSAPNAGIKVITVVSNGNSSTPKAPSDFQLTIAKSGQSPLFSFTGATQIITIPLNVSVPTTFAFNRIVAPSGYLTTFSGDCNPDGTVVVGPAQVKTCTITHSYLSVSETGPPIAVLTIIKQIDGNNPNGQTPQPGNFTIRVLKTPDHSVAAVGGLNTGINVGLASLSNNAYTVREDPSSFSRYIPIYSGDCDSAGRVTFRSDRTATCVVTNTYLHEREIGGSATALLKIIKHVDAHDTFEAVARAEEFQIEVRNEEGVLSARFYGSEIGLNVGLQAGATETSYTVSELPYSGPAHGHYLPTYAGDCSATGVVSLKAGETKTCVVTNSYLNEREIGGSATAVLKIIKHVDAHDVSGAVPRPQEFQIEVRKEGMLSARFYGSEIGLNVGLQAGATETSYTVSELPYSGPAHGHYLPTYAGDCSATGVVSLKAGETKTCVVTNSYLNEREIGGPATAVLKIIKHVDAHDTFGAVARAEEFQIEVRNEEGVLSARFYGSEIGLNVGLQAGATETSYRVSELPYSGPAHGHYLPSYAGDCSATGVVSLKAGETKTCVVTNSYLNELEIGGSATAVLKIIKHVEAHDVSGAVPRPQEFQIEVRKEGALSARFYGSEIGLNVGLRTAATETSYTVVESLDTQLTSFLPIYSGDCTPLGTLTVASGERKNCTVTNTYVGGSNLNRPPVAFGQTVSLNEDTSKSITLAATDQEGNPFSYILATLPSHGTLSGNAPNLIYTPAANYNGSDSFTFHARQGALLSNTATVSLAVLAVNDPPVAIGQTVQAIAETPLVVALSASDVENSHLTVQIVQPAHGTVTVHGLDATYTPDTDYLGSDSFKFSVSDGSASSNLATVSITVKNGIVINDTALNETNSGSVPAVFTVSLLAPSSLTTTVQYTTANANAVAGQDYTAKTGTISFGPLQISKTVSINVTGDLLFEPTELFLVQLSNPTNAVLKDGVATCTILNDDPPVGINEMSPSNATVNVHERINLALTWTHPERWRLLEKIDFRIIDDQGSVMWVQFDEPSNTFREYNPHNGRYGHPVTPGSPQRFQSNAATMYLADSLVQGSGPTGPSVVLTYSLSFKPQAAGRQFRAEVFATDDFGHQQGFDFTGNVSVSAMSGNQPSDLYLHASGNPSSLFLNQSAPTGAAQFKDSPSLNRNGGNPWREVGAWGTANPALAAGTLTALSDLRVWLGLKNSDDQGTNFDLRVEVYKNGVLATSGETYCITGVTRNPNDAKEAIVSFDPFSPVSFNGTSDVLTMKVLTRIGSDGAGGSCGGHNNAVGLRLYFDDAARPSRLQATF